MTDLSLDVEDLGGFALPEAKTLPCRINCIDKQAPDVVRVVLRLPPTTHFSFIPGQYIDVIGPGGVRRSYSLANACVADKQLELHIRAVEGGAMSQYWFGQAKANDLLAQLPKGKGPAPVHLWNPDFCGDIDMRIARDGTWFYQGTPIGRAPMVKLFSTILKLEDGKYYLVTPVEKVGIVVEDAPLHAVDFDIEGAGKDQTLTFFTKTEDEVVAGADNPIRVERDATTGEPSPYVRVRSNLEALVHRNVFYQLVELAVPREVDGEQWLGVWSGD